MFTDMNEPILPHGLNGSEFGPKSAAQVIAEHFQETRSVIATAEAEVMRYKSIVDACPLPTFIVDPDQRRTYINDAYVRMTGASLEDLKGEGWKRFIHPDDVPRVETSWRNALENGTPYVCKHRVLPPGKPMIRVLVQAYELPCKSWVGYAMPARWENGGDPLMDLSSDFERLFHLSLDLMCVADVDGFFVRVNKAWTEALGWEEDELQAHPFLELVHPEDVSSTIDVMRGMEEHKPAMRFRNRYRHKNGQYVTLSWVATPFKNGLCYAVARVLGARCAVCPMFSAPPELQPAMN